MNSPAMINRQMTIYEWTMLLGLSVLWGGSFFFNGIAVRELPALTVVVCRVAIAAVILILALKIAGAAIPRGKAVWTAFFGMGFLNNVLPFTLIVWGQTHIASGIASILNASTPLFTVIVAHALTNDEKMSAGRLVGVLVGFVGVATIIGGAVVTSGRMTIVAQIACVAASISYALAGVFGRRFRSLGVQPLATAAGQVTASSIMLLPVMLIVDRPWTLAVPGASVVGALIGVATLSTALGYVLYFRILATAGATNLLLVTLMIPVSAVLLGAVFLHETLQPRHFLGMVLIGLGLATIDGRPWNSIKGRSREACPRGATDLTGGDGI